MIVILFWFYAQWLLCYVNKIIFFLFQAKRGGPVTGRQSFILSNYLSVVVPMPLR